jgi:hypothetical protein
VKLYTALSVQHICGICVLLPENDTVLQRSNMTVENERDALKLALTQYSPDFQQLVYEMQAQASH